MNSITQKDIDRFWGRVDKEKSTIFYNGARCWEWIGTRDKDGYGVLSVNGKPKKTHRMSFELCVGELNNLFVCHHCDNPPCVNPAHLFRGTNLDNIRDRNAKGRQVFVIRYGENCNLHKLNNEQVREIRARFQRWTRGANSIKNLAKEFGVNRETIADIVSYETWKDVS